MAEIRPGDVVAYVPDDRGHGQRWWCREGTAIASEQDGKIVLHDTYWGSGGNDRLTPSEVETAKVQFNLNDFERVGDQWRWERYAPSDRAVVTSQHRLQHTWLVRIGATPDLPTQVANARQRVADAEAKVESARNSLDWERRQLAELEAKAATVDA
jgi:hypothetical protein